MALTAGTGSRTEASRGHQQPHTPSLGLSPASSSVSDPKLPPPALPQGGCVSSVCGGPPTLPHCGCMCPLRWGHPRTLPHGGSVSSVFGSPYPSTWGVCVCGGGVPPGPSTWWVCIFCVGGPPTLPHGGCVVGSPLHFHTVGISLLCVWWGPPGPSTWWAGVFSVCGGVPLGKQKTGNVYLKRVEKYSYTAMKSKYYFKNQITCGDGRNPTCRQIFKKCHLKF